MIQFRRASSSPFLLSSSTSKFRVHQIGVVAKGRLHQGCHPCIVEGPKQAPTLSIATRSCHVRFNWYILHTSDCHKMLMHVPDIHHTCTAYMSPSETVGTNKKASTLVPDPIHLHPPFFPSLPVSLSILPANHKHFSSPFQSFLFFRPIFFPDGCA